MNTPVSLDTLNKLKHESSIKELLELIHNIYEPQEILANREVKRKYIEICKMRGIQPKTDPKEAIYQINSLIGVCGREFPYISIPLGTIGVINGVTAALDDLSISTSETK